MGAGSQLGAVGGMMQTGVDQNWTSTPPTEPGKPLLQTLIPGPFGETQSLSDVQALPVVPSTAGPASAASSPTAPAPSRVLYMMTSVPPSLGDGPAALLEQ